MHSCYVPHTREEAERNTPENVCRECEADPSTQESYMSRQGEDSMISVTQAEIALVHCWNHILRDIRFCLRQHGAPATMSVSTWMAFPLLYQGCLWWATQWAMKNLTSTTWLILSRDSSFNWKTSFGGAWHRSTIPTVGQQTTSLKA